MKIINKDVYDLHFNKYIEFTVELDGGKEVFVNMAEEDYNDKIPYEDTEFWIYTKSMSEMLINDIDTEENYYETDEKERKDLYNLCINA